MSLSGTQIPYLDGVLNADPGCSMGCSYCSTKRWVHRVRCERCHDAANIHQHPERLEALRRTRKPKVIGVDFYSELFDPQRPAADIARTLEACADCPQHIFVFLTKQPSRAKRWEGWFAEHGDWWFGVTITDETNAVLSHRLSESRALNKWISYEPVMGKVEPTRLGGWPNGIDWIACGVQSGRLAFTPSPGANGWIRHVVASCQNCDIPVYVKQVYANYHCSRDPSEWPEDLCVQEMPWTLTKKKPKQGKEKP